MKALLLVPALTLFFAAASADDGQGTMPADHMKSDHMSGDHMKGDAMKGDAMKGGAMKSNTGGQH